MIMQGKPCIIMYYTWLIPCHTVFVENLPHLRGGKGNVDVAHAEVRERIDNRVDDGLWRAHRRRLTDSFSTDGMVRRRRYRAVGLPVRSLHRGWDQVVLEVAALHVAILVVRQL